MFRWFQRLGPDEEGLERITRQFAEMLEDGRHVFDLAANGLLGGADPQAIREDLFATDARINRTEMRIRREIVVHGTVHGAATFPALLVMMSLVKDAERIGDYGKNIFDLLDAGVDLGPESVRLVALKDRISKLLVRAHGLYESQDVERARAFLRDASALEDECDAAVQRLLAATDRNHAAASLAYRYFKRVVSHIGNVVTSIVMPLDKLDFYDEPGGPRRP